MPQLTIQITDPKLAHNYARQILVGSAFAFIAPKPSDDMLLAQMQNFYGQPKRRTIGLLPDGQIFPGFKLNTENRPFKLSPVLLPDKEIYQAIREQVHLLLIAPNWLRANCQDPAKSQMRTQIVIEKNGCHYRTQTVDLAPSGLTLVALTTLPEGNYRVYWKGEEATDYQGNKAECHFSVVEYVLSPLQATLLSYKLQELSLNCRLRVERFSQPFNQAVQVELWSGEQRLCQQLLEPVTTGIYHASLNLQSNPTDRLELRVSHLDQVATVVIPGSHQGERNTTLLSGLGREVFASLMPRERQQPIRGLYLSENSMVKTAPVIIVDPAPANRKAQLRWMVEAQAARLLVLNLQGTVCDEQDLGDVVPGQEIDIEVPTPGGLLAIAAWVEDKAWEGWSALLAPSTAQLEVTAPVTARPGETVALNFATNQPATVYVRVRDSRLSCASPEERLAASLKQGLEGVGRWATSGYIEQTLTQHPDWLKWQPIEYYFDPTLNRPSVRDGIVVGIDLGMTHSKVAIVQHGQPTIIANAQGIGSTPSVVAYSQDKTCLVGEMAQSEAVLNPENTFYALKRLIGRRYDEIVDETSKVAYQVINADGDVKLDCPILQQQLTPEEILAQLLHQLVEDASNYLGEQVNRAVLTVPAYFNDFQRRAIKNAAEIAGIEVLRILNESTAASLACGLDKKNNEIILVFDLGGGTFDVSILEVGDGVFEVLATCGNACLGGQEFDRRIAEHIAAEFQKTSGIDLHQDWQVWQRLLIAAEKAKIELSSVTQTEIHLPLSAATQDDIKHLDMILTRAKFEELCSDLIDRLRISVENALHEAKISKDEIDEIILVGGSSQIPAIRDLVRHLLGKEPKQSSNPDKIVALGAAIQANVHRYDSLYCLSLPDFPEEVTRETHLKRSPRTDFADVAYCGIVHTDEFGKASVSCQLPDAIASYKIEAFALSQSQTEWCAASRNLEVSKSVWAEFKLPKFIYPGDKSPAILDISCATGQFGLQLLCDGAPVAFRIEGACQIAPNTYTGQQAQVIFAAQPGRWRAVVEDLITHECDISERTVGELGRFRGLAQRFQLLRAGETLDLRSLNVLQVRVLPSLEKPFNLLCDGTANYEHHCCEQTAAKLLAAVASLMAGGGGVVMRDVILAGVAREQKMHLPRRGLALYPPEEWGGVAEPDGYWGRIAAKHLCDLSIIGESLFSSEAIKSDPEIVQALRTAIAIGEDAFLAYYQLPIVPTQIRSGRDAWSALMQLSSLQNEALSSARRYLRDHQKTLLNNVLNRTEQAYCAAALLIGGNEGDLGLAMSATNQLANSLDSNGRLYSTVDSVAMIALVTALRFRGMSTSGTLRALTEGQEMFSLELNRVFSIDEMQSLFVLGGTALVELTTEVVEDWNAFRADLPVQVQLVSQETANGALYMGDTVELVVEVERYEPGLLLHVCLPPALSRLQGGGEVKRFSVDFCGRKVVRVPLLATNYTLSPGEHWAVVVSNMFNEEQTCNPGLLHVWVGKRI